MKTVAREEQVFEEGITAAIVMNEKMDAWLGG
jgi:hypothetical protein